MLLTVLRRIILENSGVAEPHNIRELFEEAAVSGHSLLKRIKCAFEPCNLTQAHYVR